MRANHGIRAAILCAFGALASACSSPVAVDASTDVEAAALDVHDDSVRACGNFGGVWALNGWTCPGFVPFACVVQTGCDVVEFSFRTFGSTRGTVTDNSLSFEDGCTLREIGTGVASVVCTPSTGGTPCAATAMRLTDTGGQRICCDPAAHDCGAGNRCTPLFLPVTGDRGIYVTGCVEDGVLHEGEPCPNENDVTMRCSDGLVCALGVCRPPCNGDVDSCASGFFCAPSSGLPFTGACVPGCSVIDDTGCSPAQTCRLFEVFTPGAVQPARGVCEDIGSQPLGGECDDVTQCPAHSGCFFQGPANSTGHCLSYCHFGTSECGVGHHCVALVQPEVDDIGYCAPLL